MGLFPFYSYSSIKFHHYPNTSSNHVVLTEHFICFQQKQKKRPSPIRSYRGPPGKGLPFFPLIFQYFQCVINFPPDRRTTPWQPNYQSSFDGHPDSVHQNHEKHVPTRSSIVNTTHDRGPPIINIYQCPMHRQLRTPLLRHGTFVSISIRWWQKLLLITTTPDAPASRQAWDRTRLFAQARLWNKIQGL